jgi:hypothetical protein
MSLALANDCAQPFRDYRNNININININISFDG